MHVSCKNCLHLKKLPGKMLVFCKMNRLPQVYEISTYEIHENGIIELDGGELFCLAEICPIFVSMEDEEGAEGQHEDRQAASVAVGVEAL